MCGPRSSFPLTGVPVAKSGLASARRGNCVSREQVIYRSVSASSFHSLFLAFPLLLSFFIPLSPPRPLPTLSPRCNAHRARRTRRTAKSLPGGLRSVDKTFRVVCSTYGINVNGRIGASVSEKKRTSPKNKNEKTERKLFSVRLSPRVFVSRPDRPDRNFVLSHNQSVRFSYDSCIKLFDSLADTPL